MAIVSQVVFETEQHYAMPSRGTPLKRTAEERMYNEWTSKHMMIFYRRYPMNT